MNLTYIYRVETDSGSGPYSGSEQVSGLDNTLCEAFGYDFIWELHPNPRNDALDFTPGQDCCAFESLEQLSAWFTPSVSVYIPERFQISEYLVDESSIKRGKHQIALPINVLIEPVRRLPLPRY